LPWSSPAQDNGGETMSEANQIRSQMSMLDLENPTRCHIHKHCAHVKCRGSKNQGVPRTTEAIKWTQKAR
jgi:hypothetical protein